MDSPVDPSIEGENTKKLWMFGLCSIKTEIVLYDLRQSLYWQSVIEMGIMLSCFIALLSGHSLLFFLHIVHLVRPYVATRIIYRLPRTHLILEQLPENPADVQTDVVEMIVSQFNNSSAFYSHYLILSGLSAILDSIALIYNLTKTGGTSNNNIFYVNIAFLFVAFDFYVLLWSKSLVFTFPNELWSASRNLANSTIKNTNDILNEMMEQLVKGLKLR